MPGIPQSDMKSERFLTPAEGRLSIGEAVLRGAAILSAGKLDSPRLLCEQLVAHIVGCGRLEIYMRWRSSLSRRQSERVANGIKRLAGGEPIQYVLGETDFMGHIFKVNSHCLIPRPETEELVDWVAGFARLWRRKKPVLADVGTGCGCIAVTLALERPEGFFLALDNSREAVEMARRNARTHGVTRRIRFREADILSGVRARSLDAVVSNPPYVRTARLKRLSRQVKDYEPLGALDGGQRGLAVIAPLIEQAFRALKKHGFLFLEIGCDQWTEVRNLLHSAGFRKHEARNDLSGMPRMVFAEKKDA